MKGVPRLVNPPCAFLLSLLPCFNGILFLAASSSEQQVWWLKAAAGQDRFFFPPSQLCYGSVSFRKCLSPSLPSQVLTEKFRLDYCRLWQSLIKADMKQVQKYSQRLGAGDLYPLFACMLTARSWASVSRGIDRSPVTANEVCPICAPYSFGAFFHENHLHW